MKLKKLTLAAAVFAALGAGSSVIADDHGWHHKGHSSESAHHARDSHHRGMAFERIATFPVYHNADESLETVSEIVDATKDGNTLIYTDSQTGNIGFIDIIDPANPQADGIVYVGGEPTSVAVSGAYALVGVNTSPSYVAPSGNLQVVDIATRQVISSMELGGQPDSVAVSPDGRFATVVIENERDEDLGDGGLPQSPSGYLVIVDMNGTPAEWTTRDVDLTGLADVAPEDAEPEFVDINSRNIAAVTLQENNHIVYVNLKNGKIVNHYNLGGVDLKYIDSAEDDVIRLNSDLYDVPREPDAVAWIDGRRVVTANEGDWKGGSRGFSIFDMKKGLRFDSGNSYEYLAVRHGHYPESRSENKGAEPEGVEFARYGKDDYLFVGSERGNFVAVYELNNKRFPEFRQVLPVTNGPEGLKAIPQRKLFVVASEVDDAGEGLRSTVSIFKLKKGPASYPTIVSENNIPWSALSALVNDPNDENVMYTVHDSYYKEAKIYTVDVSETPAKITNALTLNCGGSTCDNLDPEGIAIDADGNFWIASEGKANIRDNLLVQFDSNGNLLQEIGLPLSVKDRFQKHGFEGVAVHDSGDLFVAFQRSTWDGGNLARIGRYNPATGEWTFYHYPMDAPTSPAGGWVGLSEITYLGDDRFAVIERDNQRGDKATLKKLYTFSVAGLTPVADNPQSDFPVLSKGNEFDLLPAMQAPKGWVQDKVEGLGVSINGEVYMVTDNDGVDDSTGETQFQHLGNVGSVFGY